MFNLDCANVKIIRDKNINITGLEQTLLFSFKALDQLLCIGNCMKTLRCNLTTFNSKTNKCNNYRLSFTNQTSFFESKDTNVYWDLANIPYDFKANYFNQYSSTKISMFTYLMDGNLAAASSDFYTIFIYSFKNFNFLLITSWTAHSTGKLRALITLKNGDLVSGAAENNIKIWDSKKNWILKKELIGHLNSITCFDLFSNGNLLSGSTDSSIKIWNSNDGRLLNSYNNGLSVNRMRILSNGDIAIANVNIKVLKSDSFSLRKTLSGHSAGINSLVEINNDYLASGSDDKTIIIWDLKNYSKKQTLIGHTARISSLVLLQNGFLASGSYDFIVKIWDTQNWLCIFNLTNISSNIDVLYEFPNGYLGIGGWMYALILYQ